MINIAQKHKNEQHYKQKVNDVRVQILQVLFACPLHYVRILNFTRLVTFRLPLVVFTFGKSFIFVTASWKLAISGQSWSS